MNFTITTGLVCSLVAGVIVWLALRGRQATLAERLRSRDDELARLNADLSALRTEHGRLSTLSAQLSVQLEAERTAHERLTQEFKALSAEALQRNNESFLKLAQATLEKYQEGAKGDLAARQLAVETLVKPLKESLEKVDKKIADFETSRLGDNKLLAERLKDLGTAQGLLHAEASKLSTALRSTTYAGSWGELQLRRVVEMADMLPYCDFSEQETAGALRADLVVRLPGGQRIVVDAKAPLEAYRAGSETTDEAVRTARFIEHAQKVRGHIDSLGAKNYWEQFQPAPEFVVLFLPGDHFLATALQSDNTLMDRALKKRVLLATPTTLIALLKAAYYGWRQEGISRDAEDIAKLGKELHERVASVAKNLDELGQRLQQAVSAYNSTVYQTESQVLVTGRRFEKLHAGSGKEVIEPRLVNDVPKNLTAPEFKE